MPKGHYERKPRTPEPVSAFEMPDGTNGRVPPEMMADARSVLERGALAEAGARWAEQMVEKHEEPITLAVPPHDMVAFKVGMWAGSLCRGWHEVDWRSADDGASLEVTLETAHGTSTLKASAGNWTEADVDAALAQMRSDLRV